MGGGSFSGLVTATPVSPSCSTCLGSGAYLERFTEFAGSSIEVGSSALPSTSSWPTLRNNCSSGGIGSSTGRILGVLDGVLDELADGHQGAGHVGQPDRPCSRFA